MTKFINNLNKYLSEMKIKQNCLSMLTGIDKNKLSLDKVSEIYKKYGFDIHDYKDLRFEN